MALTKKQIISAFLVFGLVLATLPGIAQVPDEIVLGLKQGNVKILSRYFNQNVELVVLENENVYSKAQAQQIVGNFFNNYIPEEFTVLHNSNSSKEGAKSVIGNLKTLKGNFRVYFLLKQSEGKEYIHQLRIEKQ
ncbi:MAG: DUF4783 domain-containing protein [Prolixibacteraceae bacterium]|nr:DUF4783 domain-containing protein [Prolixibacteraceae bacterium]